MTLLNNFNFNNITLPSVTFNDGIIYFLIYVIVGIIVFAAPISKILDTEADYQLRQVYKEGKPTIVVDLAYTQLAGTGNPQLPGAGNWRQLFFYDRLDPTGVSMSSLFVRSGYDVMTHNGSIGYSGVTTLSLNQNNELPVVAFPLAIHLLENRDGVILSNGLGIKKKIVLPSVGTGSTRLCVLEER